MSVPSPVAKEHEVVRLINGAFSMAFFSGMVDTITWLYPTTGLLPTHCTGTLAKAGVYFIENEIEDKGGPLIAAICCFFAGALLSGMLTSNPDIKTLKMTAATTIGIGVLILIAALCMTEEIEEAKYILAFASGLQNALLTSITGFARTTHMTGTVTDVGLLVGQGVNRATWSDESHWWKCRMLAMLVVCWVAGGGCAALLYTEDNADMAEHSMFVVAAGVVTVGILGLVHCGMEAVNEKKKAEEKMLADGHELATRTLDITSTVYRDLLSDLAASATTSENMPLSMLALAGAKPGKVHPVPSDMSIHSVEDAEELSKQKPDETQSDILSLFQFIASDPLIMQELETANPRIAGQVKLAAKDKDEIIKVMSRN